MIGAFEIPGSHAPLDWAHAYARAGLRVFPVSMNKRPLTRRGFKDASSDEAVIRAWWGRWRHAEIGWAIDEGLVVIDLDDKNGRRGLADYQTLAGISADETVTPQASTPTGGRHLIFACSGGPAKQFAGRIPGHPGIDTRVGGKGYVVLPGPGNWRAWLKPLSTPLKPHPQWAQPASAPFADDAHAGQRSFAGRFDVGPSLLAIAKRVERAVEGERNGVLFWASCRVAEFARLGRVEAAWGAEVLALAAERAGVPAPEARRTIASGLRAGAINDRIGDRRSRA
jgi:Bifunctional DNA primase/polymerase, N-terminal